MSTVLSADVYGYSSYQPVKQKLKRKIDVAGCCRGNVKHLAGLPKLRVTLAFVSREKRERSFSEDIFDPRQILLLPLQPFSQQMIRATNGLHIEVKFAKA